MLTLLVWSPNESQNYWNVVVAVPGNAICLTKPKAEATTKPRKEIAPGTRLHGSFDKYENKYENLRVILEKFVGENKSGTCLLVASKINRGPYLCSTNAVLQCKEPFSA